MSGMTDARIYDCAVRHVRSAPLRNDFTYRTVMWLVDLDRLPRLPGPLRPLARFGTGLRREMDAYLADQGMDLRGGRILMLAAAKSLGHVFNPLTVYWCHDASGSLACVVAEVHNTYGERHRYLLHPDDAARAETHKAFYVSPFYPADGRYRMSLPEPGDDLALTIRYDPPGTAPFVAVLRGRGSPATLRTVLRHALRQPCPTLLTTARIRMQGIKLFLRGLPVVPRDRASPAARIGRLYGQFTDGADLPIGVRAWDGSQTGPDGPPTLVLASPHALRRLLWSSNELGLAQAYVAGELDVEGDVAEGLRRVWARVGPDARPPRLDTARNRARLAVAALRFGAFRLRPALPASQARVRRGLHSPPRHHVVVAHHDDLPSDFYALLLDESMAYSSAYWQSTEPDYSLADAQRDKLDLICRKLDLAPGMRLLDVGCGWGGLLMHAAEHYGVEALGLTLSRQQASYITGEAARRGLADRVGVRIQHFREFSEPGAFDAAASVEMGEHVGAEAYPAYTRILHTSVKPGGRILIQQMSRTRTAAPGGGPFIESFIAPDTHMWPLDETAALWRSAGFDVIDTESLGRHYLSTVRAWRENLEQSWSKVVSLLGTENARVWRLYLAGRELAFEQGRMGVDQILAVKRGAETGGDDVRH